VLVDTLRAPYGRVTYTHGTGIDAPLDIIRISYNDSFPGPVAVIPHANWRGQYEFGSFDNGTANRCKKLPGGGNSGVCVFIDWPGNTLLNYMGHRTSSEPQSWVGALKDNWAQASGQNFYRNRYYDPVQGRFTQEDPIGLAGGLNLYGFANGDPVTFSDPFGLRPCREGDWWCLATRFGW